MAMIVQTVLGPIKPELLGRTLTHEHFSLKFNDFYVPPPQQVADSIGNDISLLNIGLIRQYPYASKYNLTFNDKETEEAVLKDVQLYKQFGGDAIVENTSHGLTRNIPLLVDISKQTGVHVIAGTGHYVAGVQPNAVLKQSEENLYRLMLSEMTENCAEIPEVKCGFIGEVGSGWPIHEFEKRCIRATAAVQEMLGCPVSFHPGRNWEAPFEIIRIFQEAGGNAKKAVMSHLERTITDTSKLLEFSDLGTYCQFDLFGSECSWYQLEPSIDMPSDAQRVDLVSTLLLNGKTNFVLLSHDIHTKHRLVQFGGHGFSHIMNNVFPKMLLKGISHEVIDKITINNPKTWLSFTPYK